MGDVRRVATCAESAGMHLTSMRHCMSISSTSDEGYVLPGIGSTIQGLGLGLQWNYMLCILQVSRGLHYTGESACLTIFSAFSACICIEHGLSTAEGSACNEAAVRG